MTSAPANWRDAPTAVVRIQSLDSKLQFSDGKQISGKSLEAEALFRLTTASAFHGAICTL